MDKKTQNTAVEALEGMIARLHGRGRLRVWSLAITVFGDSIAQRGGQVPLQVLQAVMERLNVEPGALRTALSRLASEGWVERRREGRNSFYRLAEQGRHAFDEATQRIYAVREPKWTGNWTIAIPAGESRDGAERLQQAGFASRTGSVWYRPEIASPAADKLPDDEFLIVTGKASRLPAAVSELWDTAETAKAMRDFAAALQPLGKAFERGDRLDGIDAMAARTLLIHDWRRIVLRATPLPVELLPADWPGATVRGLVKRIYAQVAAPSEAWLDKSGLPPITDRAGFSARFGIVPRIESEAI